MPGQSLGGAMTLCKDADAKAAAQYPVTYLLPAPIRPGKAKTQPEAQSVAYAPEKHAKTLTKLQELQGAHTY